MLIGIGFFALTGATSCRDIELLAAGTHGSCGFVRRWSSRFLEWTIGQAASYGTIVAHGEQDARLRGALLAVALVAKLGRASSRIVSLAMCS